MVEEVICDLRLATSGSFGLSMEEQRSVPENAIGWKKQKKLQENREQKRASFFRRQGEFEGKGNNEMKRCSEQFCLGAARSLIALEVYPLNG